MLKIFFKKVRTLPVRFESSLNEITIGFENSFDEIPIDFKNSYLDDSGFLANDQNLTRISIKVITN